jgi:hypothetical protein
VGQPNHKDFPAKISSYCASGTNYTWDEFGRNFSLCASEDGVDRTPIQ